MFGLKKFGDGICFPRLERYCNQLRLDVGYLARKSVVVVGSNGKGTTAVFLSKMLETQFANVGLFTSPHLRSVCERFHSTVGPISEDKFASLLDRALNISKANSKELGNAGEFELLFIVALMWFSEEDPDFIVWEAGIGGRYDPVRFLRASIGVLTTVELEHTELLGSTTEMIAYDKADVLYEGGHLFVSLSVENELSQKIETYCRLRGVTIERIKERVDILSSIGTQNGSESIVSVDNSKINLHLRLSGLHQVKNSISALLAAAYIFRTHNKNAEIESSVRALAGTTWPLRLEKVSSNPAVWIDVGHTWEAVECVAQGMLSIYSRDEVLVVLGVSKNKNKEEIARVISESFSHVFVAQAHHDGESISAIEKLLPSQTVVGSESDIESAVEITQEIALRSSKVILVVGSLFLGVEYATCLEGRNPRDLCFF